MLDNYSFDLTRSTNNVAGFIAMDNGLYSVNVWGKKSVRNGKPFFFKRVKAFQFLHQCEEYGLIKFVGNDFTILTSDITADDLYNKFLEVYEALKAEFDA